MMITKSRSSLFALTLAVAVPGGSISGLRAAGPESLQIDRFIEEGHQRHRITANAPSTDEEFLRRLYLDLAGRIPTFGESQRFLEDEAPNKRTQLIDSLLESEAFVYSTFNWWADILRIKSDAQGGVTYKQWLLNSIRENVPYDEMVRQLVNPFPADSKKQHAFAWENGAVGYYLRDDGMPLDNMSNTVQIFLGTRLVCAQCHNHPFDKWSQMDYFKMAAFTYGIDTRIRPEDLGLAELTGEGDRRRRNRDDNNEYVREAMQDVLQPLQYGVRETGRQVQLPHDYQYRDAKPYEEVRSGTMFGDRTKSSLDAYAEWLTSTENPRFTTVIVNRLWKRVMGWGLIEPVDDMRDDTEASNPALLTFLEREMQRKKFDTKEFLRMLLNTRTYQRQACGEDIPDDTHYHFPGPLLRRMTAEQMWDSFMTVAVPGVDERTMTALAYPQEDRYQRDAEKLLALKSRELVELIKNVAAEYQKFDEARTPLQEQMAAARSGGDGGRARELQQQIEALSATRDAAVNRIKSEAFAGGGDSSMAMMRDTQTPEPSAAEAAASEAPMMGAERWQGFDKGYIRAVALESPAPAGHFLRQFGQSDRETIENSSTDASVDQALTLLNSPIFEQVFNDKSPVMQALAQASTAEEKQDVLFLSMLSRYPRDEDRAAITRHVEAYGEQKAYRHIAWALMNTQEFAFLQ